MGIQYQYKRLDNHNFTGHSLDDFVRRQTVAACWKKIDNNWKLVPNVYEENWSQAQCREIAEDVVQHISLDQTGFGAFDGGRIIGFAIVSHRIFGIEAFRITNHTGRKSRRRTNRRPADSLHRMEFPISRTIYLLT